MHTPPLATPAPSSAQPPALATEPSTHPATATDQIVLQRAVLERLALVLQRGYTRHPMREIKQAVDTIQHVLATI